MGKEIPVFSVTKTDEDGEKELIPISEIIAKTLREATKAAK